MYSRNIHYPAKNSFFLFGPRGTGKTTWLRQTFPEAQYIDLLEAELYTTLLANPQRLEQLIRPASNQWIILDEVQRVPALLHEVHRLIEAKHYKFILTGSSARKLKQKNVDLLAGRALTYHLYPLTVQELGADFNLEQSLRWGHLPMVFSDIDSKQYLQSYVATYIREEVLQEGLTRNIGAFSRFLEAASFSQAQILNMSAVARDCAVHRKVAEGYFEILEDLLMAERVPAFTQRAKRLVVVHPKFFFFDVGVYQAIRPRGPLDTPEEIGGAALETLVYQELKAVNEYCQTGYTLYYWRTIDQVEVDFVLYGERGIIAIEIKRSANIQSQHLHGLQAFRKDYPTARCYMVYGGQRQLQFDGVTVIPITDFLKNLKQYL